MISYDTTEFWPSLVAKVHIKTRVRAHEGGAHSRVRGGRATWLEYYL